MTEEITAQIPLDRPMEYAEMENFIRLLAAEYSLHLQVIGTSLGGQAILAVCVGEASGDKARDAVLYVGGMEDNDWVSSAILMRFLRDYCVFHKEERRLYGVNLPYLWENRTIYVIPCLHPDGVCTPGSRKNKPVLQRPAFLQVRDGFHKGMPFDFSEDVHIAPECAALCQYCRFTPTRLCLYLTASESENNAAGEGVFATIPDCPGRAVTIGKLLSRMASWEFLRRGMEGSLAAWYSDTEKFPAIQIALGSDRTEVGYYYGYAALREVLFSAPLLL